MMHGRTRHRALIAGLAVWLALGTTASWAAPSAYRLAVHGVDTSKYPEVRVQVTMPAELLGDASVEPEFTVSENGQPVRDVKASVVDADTRPTDIVLVIDTSGSMKGEPIEDAKAAALAFVRALDGRANIAVISFSSKPSIKSGYTTDEARLVSAISGLRASGETAVYDALVSASRLGRTSSDSQRSIVLLSDGGDTVSVSTIDSAIKALRGAGVQVLGVTLESPEFNPAALATVAERSGGRLIGVKDSKSLAGSFEGVARELSSRYEITYRSSRPSSKDVELDVSAKADGKTAVAATVYDNPDLELVPTSELKIVPGSPANPMITLASVVVLAFISVGLLVSGVFLILLREPTTLKQLRFYDQLQSTSRQASAADRDSLTGKIQEAVGYVAGKSGLTKAVAEKLEQAGLPLRPVEYMTMHILAVFAVGFGVQLLSGSLVLAVGMVFVAAFVPILLIEMKVSSRRESFEEQLPQMLNLMSGSLRAGWGLTQALDLIAHELPPPASVELRRVQTEVRLGRPIEQALEQMANRLDSKDFHWVVSAIAVQREVGGNLAEVLDIVADTMRERGALRRHARALSAEGRLSAGILFALPVFEAVVLTLMNREYMSLMVVDPLGRAMGMLAIVLLAVGGFWFYKVIKVEV